MKEGDAKLTFITSRKGAVLADAIVHAMQHKVLLDVDITAVESLIDHIKSYIVMEDVQVINATETTHWLWALGPQRSSIKTDAGITFQLPKDFLGIEGFAIALEPSQVVSTWNSIVNQGARPIGWYALNMARIEQGAPIFMIDFDQNNLPHETSLIQSRVRFDKGCYLGQEIVARMESLGKPKKRLVELRMDTDELPVAGSQLWEDETGSGTPIGIVTSSAISPLSGGVPLLIAMVGKKHAVENATIYTYVGPEIVSATIVELHQSIKKSLHDIFPVTYSDY